MLPREITRPEGVWEELPDWEIATGGAAPEVTFKNEAE